MMKPGRTSASAPVFALALAASLLLAPPLRAEGVFRVVAARVEIAERGLVDSLRIIDHTNAYSIIPPLGWRLRLDPAQKQLNFLSTNGEATISLKFAPTNTALVPEPDLEALQAGVEERYNEGKVYSHFPGVTGMVPGEGFDLRWRAAGRHFLHTRLVLIPYEWGTIEASLSGPEEVMESERRVFSGFLNSLTRERRGTRRE